MSKFNRVNSTFWRLFIPLATVICCLAALLVLLPPFGGLALARVQLVKATVGPQIEVYTGTDSQSIDKASITASKVSYDPDHNRFLVVWYDGRDFPSNGIWGRLLNGDGTPYGDAFSLCTTANNPMVAFDSASQRFLVVWNGIGGVTGQFLQPDGSLQGSEVIISDIDVSGHFDVVSLVYSAADQRFLVLLLGPYGASTYNLFGRFVSTGGVIGNTHFPITELNSGYGVWRCAAAYDSNNNRFLVAYGHNTAMQTCARLVNGNGSVGSEMVLSTALKSLFAAAFDPVHSRFLVLWNQAFGDFSDLSDHGHLFNADLTPHGGRITVTLDHYPGAFDVTYDADDRRFLVVGSSYNQPVFGRVLNLDGSPCGSPFTILDQWHMDPVWPYISYGTKSIGALAVYGDAPVPENGIDIFGNMVKFTIKNPVVPPILNLLLD